jgi:hypothetical protein
MNAHAAALAHEPFETIDAGTQSEVPALVPHSSSRVRPVWGGVVR